MKPLSVFALIIGLCISNLFTLAMNTKLEVESKAAAKESESHLSHLRNLNWLLARQIERQKGGEQLNPSKP